MNTALATRASMEDAIARTAERFARAARWRGAYHYVVGKLRGDPATAAIAARAPLGDVLDLGCGRGQLVALLLESGAATRARGCDTDEAKLAFARRATEGLDAVFTHGDVRSAELGDADTVLLVDVLHYVDRAAQDALLARAARLVRPGGRLIVREASAGLGWRTWTTIAAEWLAKIVRLNRGDRLVFRDVAREVAPILEAAGMTCSIDPCWRGTPFGNVLLVATRA